MKASINVPDITVDTRITKFANQKVEPINKIIGTCRLCNKEVCKIDNKEFEGITDYHVICLLKMIEKQQNNEKNKKSHKESC